MLPFAAEFFDSLNANGTISVSDTKSFSQFILYGQITIMKRRKPYPGRKSGKNERIHEQTDKVISPS